MQNMKQAPSQLGALVRVPRRDALKILFPPHYLDSEAMNARVCSALKPEVFPKYRRSLETASTEAEIASASSGVLERVVIIVVAENALAANDPTLALRASGSEMQAGRKQESPAARGYAPKSTTYS